MSDKLTHALLLAGEHAFRVFPLRPMLKLPIIKAWQHEATTDEDRIHAWWEEWPNANIGVATGRGLVVLDVDCKKGKRGAESLARLDLDIGLPVTMRVTTPTGGVHLYLKTDPTLRVPNSVSILADYPDIDVRGENGYVVGRGSTVKDGMYV